MRTAKEIQSAVNAAFRRPVLVREETALLDAGAGCNEVAQCALLALADALAELAECKAELAKLKEGNQ